MTDKAKLDELRALAEAATPQEFDTAQECVEGVWIECPVCDGQGEVEQFVQYHNYDGAALGVQFYGIGDEHVNAEAYYRAANPKTVLALLDRIDELEAGQAEADV